MDATWTDEQHIRLSASRVECIWDSVLLAWGLPIRVFNKRLFECEGNQRNNPGDPGDMLSNVSERFQPLCS